MTTTKQVGDTYQHDASFGGTPLWRGAAADVVRICHKYHRARAIEMLDRLAEIYKRMAISSTYKGAANTLRDE